MTEAERIQLARESLYGVDMSTVNYSEIGRQFGFTNSVAMRLFQPGFRERARAREKIYRERHGISPAKGRADPSFLRASHKPKQAEYAARLAEVPNDTRTAAQCLLGDPLPGRSALDKERLTIFQREHAL